MNIDITARNITPSSELKEMIYQKIDKLSQYDHNINSAKIVLLKESRAEKVEIIISSEGHTYITKCYSSKFEKTFSKAIDNIINQIKKNKPKH